MQASFTSDEIKLANVQHWLEKIGIRLGNISDGLEIAKGLEQSIKSSNGTYAGNVVNSFLQDKLVVTSINLSTIWDSKKPDRICFQRIIKNINSGVIVLAAQQAQERVPKGTESVIYADSAYFNTKEKIAEGTREVKRMQKILKSHPLKTFRNYRAAHYLDFELQESLRLKDIDDFVQRTQRCYNLLSGGLRGHTHSWESWSSVAKFNMEDYYSNPPTLFSGVCGDDN